ncbi:thioredoxin family protein [Helicobacter sp. MIT 21-1697]|uniref:thioredoxin family protein n=1 Tax=Helicobacter sp. MIT 21-1697 TaxID=2993733 RepID=UPI00224AE6E1|nr:thioredoxin family protein [Helicobacter sp. MIT 21-1697]MCX2717055.1 thioredoxin family protein [Helicobacter sp. MIT 21-1697]
MIESIDSKRFYEVIQQGCVVVDFSAPWCPDCRHIEPMLETLAQEFAGKIHIFKISFDTQVHLKDELNIRKIPTLIFYKDGREVGERLIEPHSIENIRSAFNALL